MIPNVLTVKFILSLLRRLPSIRPWWGHREGYNTVVLLSLWSLAHNPTPWRRPGRNVPTKALQKHEAKPRNPVLHISALGLRLHQALKDKDWPLSAKQMTACYWPEISLSKGDFSIWHICWEYFSPYVLQICRVLQRTAMLLIFFREYGFREVIFPEGLLESYWCLIKLSS